MLYRFGQGVLRLLFHTFYDIEVIGESNLPKSGSAIVCANHISVLDPVLLGAFLDRPLCFMAKQELFKFKPLGALITALGAFPVNRDAVELTTIKRALDILKSGNAMGIFSQGGRMLTREVNVDAGKAGVALFATRSESPVIPVGIKGSFRPFTRVTIHVGEPIIFSEHNGKKLRTPELAELTKKIMIQIKKLSEDKTFAKRCPGRYPQVETQSKPL